MKRLFPILATLPSLLFAAPTFSQHCLNGWCRAGCYVNEECDYVKVISKEHPYVKFLVSYPGGMIKQQADCQQYKSRFVRDDGSKSSWEPAKPQSIGHIMIETACTMKPSAKGSTYSPPPNKKGV